MNVVLLSTYDLGHQPFGLASPAAWLGARGHEVTLADLAVQDMPAGAIRDADVVCFYLPMHTAARLASNVISKTRSLNAKAKLIAYGLYASPNAEYLRDLGVGTVLSGEYERSLCDAVEGCAPAQIVSMERLTFLTPERAQLPGLERYSKLRIDGEARLAGYTEASRGCKHLCRHCPIVPVYQGAFRVVQQDVVLSDIHAQVAAGARHITFGDPDFFNGPAHAMRIVRGMAHEFPGVTYDVTIKIEHILQHREYLRDLRATGCAFLTSAVESIDNDILEKLDKGHTRDHFFTAFRLCRDASLPLLPTFVPFTPWTTPAGYRELLRVIVECDLVDHVAPIQLALRLLIPPDSRLLELDDIREAITHFDRAALLHRWSHRDPAMDELAASVLRLVSREQKENRTRREIFRSIWELVNERAPENFDLLPRAAIPYMDEPWYC
ncbi:MAG: radical SAM protein [Candidatus Solibacter usitatus]|nr:radical SAM protein [Candidatus Solibacter usitatus]